MKEIEIPFKASRGFLRNFKERYGIRQLSIQGEKLSADEDSIQDFLVLVQNLINSEGFTADQMYNSDESGLYWKALPTKTLASAKEMRAEGLKINKERVTLNCCANASGCDRLPLLIIGKSKNPRALKNCIKNLPVLYKSSLNAWMTTSIFCEWLHDCFIPHVVEYLTTLKLPLKAVLFIDNATVHHCDFHTSKMQLKVIFLPPNTTALIQPMDQGVISAFKRNYKSVYTRRLLTASDTTSDQLIDCMKKYNLKDCIFTASDTWKSLSNEVLKNCWHKIGVTSATNPISQLTNNLDLSCVELFGFDKKDMEELYELDESSVGYELMTDNEIVDYTIKDQSRSSEEEGEKVNNEENEEISIEDLSYMTRISHANGIECIRRFIDYVEENAVFDNEVVEFLKKLNTLTETFRFTELQQQKITDFLTSNK